MGTKIPEIKDLLEKWAFGYQFDFLAENTNQFECAVLVG
jgi:hypothetical protein